MIPAKYAMVVGTMVVSVMVLARTSDSLPVSLLMMGRGNLPDQYDDQENYAKQKQIEFIAHGLPFPLHPFPKQISYGY